jgi:hypothetical protein
MGLLDDAIREHLELKRLRGADPSEIARAEREALGPVRRAVDPAEEEGAGASRELALDPDGHAEDLAWADQVGQADSVGHEGHAERTGEDPHARQAGGVSPTAEHEDLVSEPVDDQHEPRLAEADDWLAHDPPSARAEHEQADPSVDDEHATQVYRAPTSDPESAAAEPAPAQPLSDPTGHDSEDAGSDRTPDAHPASSRPPAPPAPSEQEAHPEAAGDREEKGEDVLEETPDFLQETPEHDRLWFEQRPPRDFDFDK